MEFETEHIGSAGGRPAHIIELTVRGANMFFTVDVTDSNGKVDINLIISLRELADELEEQNRLIEAINN